MNRMPEKASDVLARVRALLDADKPGEAAELVRRVGIASRELANAYGVALMRKGEAARAVEVYRDLLVSGGGVCLKADIPTVYKTNFATALLLTKNLAGCLAVLRDTDDEHDAGVVQLRRAVERWTHAAGWWQRLRIRLFADAPAEAIQLDFAPGRLPEPSPVRPLAS